MVFCKVGFEKRRMRETGYNGDLFIFNVIPHIGEQEEGRLTLATKLLQLYFLKKRRRPLALASSFSVIDRVSFCSGFRKNI